MRGLRGAGIAEVFALGAGAAAANDSTAELATGGLRLAKMDAIAIRSEALAISAKAIVVRYRFVNIAPEDKTVTVAFPMPGIVGRSPDDNFAVPFPEAQNFLAFETKADGGPVKTEHEEKAIAIDKGARDSLVSFCAEGVKGVGATTFEVRHSDFTPTRDLDILILDRQKP